MAAQAGNAAPGDRAGRVEHDEQDVELVLLHVPRGFPVGSFHGKKLRLPSAAGRPVALAEGHELVPDHPLATRDCYLVSKSEDGEVNCEMPNRAFLVRQALSSSEGVDRRGEEVAGGLEQLARVIALHSAAAENSVGRARASNGAAAKSPASDVFQPVKTKKRKKSRRPLEHVVQEATNRSPAGGTLEGNEAAAPAANEQQRQSVTAASTHSREATGNLAMDEQHRVKKMKKAPKQAAGSVPVEPPNTTAQACATASPQIALQTPRAKSVVAQAASALPEPQSKTKKKKRQRQSTVTEPAL